MNTSTSACVSPSQGRQSLKATCKNKSLRGARYVWGEIPENRAPGLIRRLLSSAKSCRH